MKEVGTEIDKYTLDFLKKLERDKDFPSEIVLHLPRLRIKIDGIPKIRSSFGKLIYELINPGGNWKEILPILSTIEIYAISTYVLDDIFDKQPIRQNDLATWKKFNITSAIIAGILQRDIGIKILSELKVSKEKLLQIIQLYEEADYLLYIGQNINEKMTSTKITEKDYVKRCAAITQENPAMARMIGIVTGVNNEELNVIEELGRKFGTLAMMRNDFMNLVPEKVKAKTATVALKGKTYEDIRKGLMTYPIIYFLTNSKATKKDKDFILKALGNWEAPEKDLLKVIKLLVESGSILSYIEFMMQYKKDMSSYIKINFQNKLAIKNINSFLELFENVKPYYKLMNQIK
jgi:geranylgeranyl pyrophosphate synthase